MIVHLFNSSSVSGPERLVVPALAKVPAEFLIVNLLESRIEGLRNSDPLADYCRDLHLRYLAVPVGARLDRSAIRRLRELLGEMGPGLVHAHAVKASIYLSWARRGLPPPRFPIVSTHHGVRGLPDWKTRLYERIYRNIFLKGYDRVLCVSTSDYQDVLRSGIPARRLRLHLNGIDGHRVHSAGRPEEARKIRALWLPDEKERDRLFLFGIVGRLSKEKDHSRIFRVLAHLNGLPIACDWRCLVFGAGILENKLRQEAKDLRLEGRIVWMGYRNNVADELAGLDLVLSFSKAEGLPLNLIEAGLAGTPVMGTRVGGNIDLMPDERYGILVSPEEPVEESARRLSGYLTEEGRRQLVSLGEQLQKKVLAEFSQDQWVRRLQAIYAELQTKVGE